MDIDKLAADVSAKLNKDSFDFPYVRGYLDPLSETNYNLHIETSLFKKTLTRIYVELTPERLSHDIHWEVDCTLHIGRLRVTVDDTVHNKGSSTGAVLTEELPWIILEHVKELIHLAGHLDVREESISQKG